MLNLPSLDTTDATLVYFDKEVGILYITYDNLILANKAKANLVRNKVPRVAGPTKLKGKSGQYQIQIPHPGWDPEPNVNMSEVLPTRPSGSNDVLLKHIREGKEPVWPPVVEPKRFFRRGKKRNKTPGEIEEDYFLNNAGFDDGPRQSKGNGSGWVKVDANTHEEREKFIKEFLEDLKASF